MHKLYLKSLQIIKQCKIKTPKEYRKISKYFLILNIESLKWIAQTRSWRKIIKIANEV